MPIVACRLSLGPHKQGSTVCEGSVRPRSLHNPATASKAIPCRAETGLLERFVLSFSLCSPLTTVATLQQGCLLGRVVPGDDEGQEKEEEVRHDERGSSSLDRVHYGAEPFPYPRQESVKQQSARAANLTPMDPVLVSRQLVSQGPHRVLVVAPGQKIQSK